MNWPQIILGVYLAFLVFGNAGLILMIGRPREPLTPGTVVIQVGINSLVIAALLTVWSKL